MEVLSSALKAQFLFPATAVAAVLVCAILVFIFGFKSAEQPKFEKLSAGDDKKRDAKKRKTKEKVIIDICNNGHIICNIIIINLMHACSLSL